MIDLIVALLLLVIMGIGAIAALYALCMIICYRITFIIYYVRLYRLSRTHYKRLDEISRVHIPKEIREKLNLESLDYVKVYCKNNKIVIKKFGKVKALKEKAQREVEA